MSFPTDAARTFTNSLTEVLRDGARALPERAVQAEVAEFLAHGARGGTRKRKANGSYKHAVNHNS
jgi:hypothetical protein